MKKKIQLMVKIFLFTGLALGGIILIMNSFSSYFQYKFEGKVKPETDARFRKEYLLPLCQKLSQKDIQLDKSVPDYLKVNLAVINYSILKNFKTCDEFIKAATIKHSVSSVTIDNIFIVTYDLGPNKIYYLQVKENQDGTYEFSYLKGKGDTILCYGPNISLQYFLVSSRNPEEITNRQQFFDNINSQCAP